VGAPDWSEQAGKTVILPRTMSATANLMRKVIPSDEKVGLAGGVSCR